MKRLSILFVLLGYQITGTGQSYSFKTTSQYDHFEIQSEGNQLFCLFRASERKALVTVFRKVYLNDSLQPVDSIEYSLTGSAELLCSGGDEKYSFHAFYTKVEATEKIIFFVTNNFDKTHASFSKTAIDFTSYFSKPVKKLKNIHLTFLNNNGSPGMILVQPYLTRGSTTYPGKIFALSANDGKEIWTCSAPLLFRTQTTDSLLIGTTTAYPSGGYSNPSYQIHFVDKSNGRLLKSMAFYNGQGFRSISVFATNSRQLMVAGSEYPSGNTKNGRFYMSMFALNGEKIFDQVDSAARFSTRRLHLMGNVFDQEGNLILIGEGWKVDATRAVATTAASVLLAAAIGGVPGVYTGVDHKIDNVVFATLSPVDGKVINFKSFPVGPWYDYGNLMTAGSHVLIAIANQVIIYDVNEPNSPPKPFTSLRSRENLLLTPYGPLIGKWNNHRDGYVISFLH